VAPVQAKCQLHEPNALVPAAHVKLVSSGGTRMDVELCVVYQSTRKSAHFVIAIQLSPLLMSYMLADVGLTRS
jgi:hypothetical protein